MNQHPTHCPHCNRETLRSVGPSIDCTNKDCPAYAVTLPPAEFMALTPERLAEYQNGQTLRKELQAAQDTFEARVAELVQAAAVREASRHPGEKLFG